MIRIANIDDLTKFSGMAREFSEQSGRKDFNDQIFISSWTSLLSAGVGHVYGRFVDNVPRETIAVLTYVDPFEGKNVATVAFWHLQHEPSGLTGGMLFKQMMEDMRQRGISQLFFSALLNSRFPKVTQFLKSAGFDPVELHFKKEL